MGSYKQPFGLTTGILLFAALAGCGGGGEPDYVTPASASPAVAVYSAPMQVAEEPKPEPKPGSGPSPAPTPVEPKPVPPTAPTPAPAEAPPPAALPPQIEPPSAEPDQAVSAAVLATIVRVKVRPESISFDAAGATQQLIAHALDADGNVIPGVTFTWRSGGTGSLTVSSSGLLTARANGAATITATVLHTDHSATAQAVVKLPETLVLTPEVWPANEVWIGARRQFDAQVVNGRGAPLPGYDMTWTSSNTNVLRVDNTGLVTAHGRGNARITVTTGSLTEGVDVIVNGEGSNVPGYMYTTWAGRTDDTPVWLAGGRLRFSEIYYPEAGYPLGNLRYAEINAPWPHDTIEKFQYRGNRVALLTDVANGAGTLRVLDRASEWTILSLGEARDFALEGNLIAMLQADGRLRVKNGTHDEWTDVASGGIAYFELEGDRIGLLREDGTAYVMEGMTGDWHPLEAAGVTQLQLEGDRIGVLTKRGEFLVKDEIGGAFTTLAASGATRFRLEGERVALEVNGELRVKQGIPGEWRLLANEPLRQFELEGDRIAILFESGRVRAKDGIDGTWRELAADGTGVREIQLQGNRIGQLMSDGHLRIKTGLDGAFADTAAPAGSVTQFRLIVDNPVAPHRTTPSSYAAAQTRCVDLDEADGDPILHPEACYPDFQWRPVAPFYGVYCGWGRPQVSLTDARAPRSDGGLGGPIDGLDFLCNHHDAIDSWYPEATGDDDDVFGACIVRYGLRNGRLTLSGSVIAHGWSDDDTWEDAWESAGMAHLKGALDGYFTHTYLVCDDEGNNSDLAQFDRMTDASH